MSSGAAPTTPDYQKLFIEDPDEIHLWDQSVARIVASLAPKLMMVTPDAYGSVLDTASALSAQMADRIIKLRRLRLSQVIQPDPPKISLL
jgi:hypothetical protein